MILFAKIVRKIYISLIILLLAIIRLILVSYILLHSNAVQNYLVKKTTNILSENLNTEVKINYVDFEFFNKLVLKDVYIEDLQKDTLLYVGNLKLALKDVDFQANTVFLDKIGLHKSYFNLYSDSTNIFNYEFLTDAFKSEKQDTVRQNWRILCNNFELVDSKIKYIAGKQRKNIANKIDFKDLYLTGINLKINNFSITEDTIKFNVIKLEFHEKSNFSINNFHAACSINPSKIHLSNLIIHTENSKLNFSEFVFSYNNFNDDFRDFVNKVKLKSRITSSELGLADLSFFIPEFSKINQSIFISGNIKGKINRLKIKDLELFYGNNTHIDGKINIDGLPDIDNTFIHAAVTELTTSANDLEKIPLPPFDERKTLKLPGIVKEFGNIFYSGKFTGFISDFVAYGNFITSAGNINSDISIKQDTLQKHIVFTGNIKTENLNIGKILKNETKLGHLSLNVKVDGYSNTNKKNFKGKFDGIINSVDFLGYNYHNIELEGDIINKMYDGMLKINDPNIYMDFLGRFDFNKEIPVFDFTVDITDANLFKLNIDTIDSVSAISFFSTANFVGNKLDDIEGDIGIYNIEFRNNKGNMRLNKLNIKSVIENKKRNIDIKSELADAKINGSFKFSTLQNTYYKFIKNYADILVDETTDVAEDNKTDEFTFDIDLKKTKQLSKLFIPGYVFSDKTQISGYFSSQSDSLNFTIDADSVLIKGTRLENISASISTNNDNLNLRLKTKKFSVKENVYIENVQIENTLKNNLNKLNITWKNNDTTEYSGEIFANAGLYKSPATSNIVVDIELTPSIIVIDNDMWYINDCHFMIDSSSISVNNFTFNKEHYYYYANGVISEKAGDSLVLIFNEIALSDLSFFLGNKSMQFNGKLNGELKLTGLYNTPMAIAMLTVDNLSFNKSIFGDMYINSVWDNVANKVDIDAYIKNGNLKTVAITGKYFTKADLLDFKLSLNKLKLSLFESFVGNNVSKLRGLAGGDIFITGKPEKPVLNGKISLQKTAFTLDYLKTRYNFTDFVFITKNQISLEAVKLYDKYGNEAILSGSLKHNNFKDITFSSNLVLDKFLVLNTHEKDNELFYGKAFMSGFVNIDGNTENIEINIDAKTEKYYHKFEKRTEYTKFNIPLLSGENASENNFISFINTGVDTTSEEKYKVDLSGIKMNFDLEVTPDAEVQIIFDSKVGDVVKAKGNSNLKLEINTLGNFTINGEYVIEEGDYLFTLQNVINKKLDIEKGSNIKWDGDPYNAYLNINAIYRLKASLYDLTLDSSLVNRVPVECHLKMTNSLLAPDISFSVFLPTGNDQANGILSRMSPTEINKQILSLLVLNRFNTPSSFSGMETAERKGSGAVGVTSSELLSNQLSHWLSQISNDFDIGVNYRPGDELTKDELEVALSTQIFNDRVSINGNVGVGGQNTATSNIVGDFVVDVKLNKSGKLKLKGYNKANQNLIYEESPYTQGVGLFYKEDFNSWSELMKRYFKKKKQ